MLNAAHSARSSSPGFARFAFFSLAAFAAFNALVLWSFHGPMMEGYGDFASFYTAGKIVRGGQSPRLYDPKLQWQIQQQFAANVKIRVGPLPYVRPPYEALLFVPLSHLSYPAAFLVWLALKVVLLVGIAYLVPLPHGAAHGSTSLALRTLLCIGFFPVGFDLLQGQDSILVLAIVVGAYCLLVRGWDSLSGMTLALALFKFHIIVPLFLVLALQKRVRFVLGFIVAGVALFLISLRMVNWAGILAYPNFLWLLNRVPGYGMVHPDLMPNIRGLIALFIRNESFTAAEHWVLLMVVAVGLAVAARFYRNHADRDIGAAVSFSIVVILVTSYYSNCSDLTLLLLPLLLLGGPVLRSQSKSWGRQLFVDVSAFLLCTPLLWFLLLRVKRFGWMALVLVLFAISIWAITEELSIDDPSASLQA